METTKNFVQLRGRRFTASIMSEIQRPRGVRRSTGGLQITPRRAMRFWSSPSSAARRSWAKTDCIHSRRAPSMNTGS